MKKITGNIKNILSRNATILKFREDHTLQETGDEFGITAERVRQIEMLKDRKRCLRHNRFYYDTCSYCLIDDYKKLIGSAGKDFVMSEVKKEAKNRKRDGLSVQRRKHLIKVLHNNYHMSDMEIAYLFDRDRTTVLHHINT